MTRSLRAAILPLFFLACLFLGGSTRTPWTNMLLQLGAVAILAWAALARPQFQSGSGGRQLALIVGAALLIVVAQLIPMPPELWSALPGRASIAAGYDLLGQPRPWLPLSLAPYDTMTSALWLLPPLAILAGILRLGAYRESWMAVALVVAALVGVILIALQFAGEGAARWYFYPVTNDGAAVGFFANANHMAILLVATMPFLVALHEDRGDARRRQSSRRARASAGKIAILGGALLVVIVGIALNGSMAGIGLGAASLAASLFIHARFDRPLTRWGLGAVALAAVGAVGLLVASPMQNNLTGTGVEGDYGSRFTSFGNSIRATVDHLPTGSGLGSFAAVYPSYENPDWVERWYVNHVHNDYIELALETGVPGMLLMLAFLLWWAASTFAIWRSPAPEPFAKAATIASGAILLHSLVDFPLRSTGIAVIFAFAIAMMVGLRRRAAVETVETDSESGARHLSVG